MILLILGLLIFLGVLSTRFFAEDWRTRTRQRVGEGTYKGVYTVLMLLGLVLIIWGYAQARQQPVALWAPQLWARQLATVLMLGAFVLMVAAYLPRNGIKARVHHPMLLSVKLWALAHLLANHTLADLLLFGSFLVWSVLNFRAARQRDRAIGTVYPAGRLPMTLLALLVGAIVWFAFARWAHVVLFNVKPLG